MVLTAAKKDETAHLEALEVAVLIAPQEQGVRRTGPIRVIIRVGAVEKAAVIGQVVKMTITTTVGVVADLVIDLLVQVLQKIRKISWLRVCVTKFLSAVSITASLTKISKVISNSSVQSRMLKLCATLPVVRAEVSAS